MTKDTTYNSQRAAELAAQILHHKNLYYAGTPEIADSDYDALEDELRRLAPEHPVLSKVGTDLPSSSGVTKVRHDRPLLSLQKTYDVADLLNWAGTQPVVGTIKVDGNSLSLIYEAKRLRLAKTRGNGQVGEDVTAKAAWVTDIVPQLRAGHKIEVRGELYCTEPQFLHLSECMVQQGFDRPTNPRNIVAGLLGRKGHNELMRFVNFFAFDVLDYDDALGLRTEMQKFSWLEQAGFNLPYPERLSSKVAIESYLFKTKQVLEEGDIGLDGAVFSYDDLRLHSELGFTSHHPRFKMSFKWQGQTAQAKIKEVIWATSRLGIITPVAVIEPVYLSGAQITNVTLHNAAHVKAYNLKSGDVVEIVRSGEVIPKFLQVIQAAAGEFHWPDRCPACAAALVFDDVRLKCSNLSGCPAQQLGTILNWIRAAEIDDLSEKRLLNLMNCGLVRTMADLYRLKPEDFYQLPQTKERMAAKLFANIQASRSLPLVRFLSGLGIEGAGLTTWEKLLVVFPSIDALLQADAASIEKIDGFAAKSASQIVSGLHDRQALIADLLAAGVSPTPPAPRVTSAGTLTGKTLVITGALSRPRDELEAAIKAAGGKLGSSVSKNTFALITDDPTSDSSKMRKARELGVTTWSEADLLAALQQSSN